MPVVGSPKLKGQRTFSVDDRPTMKARRSWQVRCDDAEDGADVAAAACAAVGSPFSEAYPTLLLRSQSVDEGERLADGGVMYEVTEDFSTDSGNPNGGSPEASDPNPTLRPGVLRLTFAASDETFWQVPGSGPFLPAAEDADGAAVTGLASTWVWGRTICNSAGKAHKEGLRETVYDAVYTFEKNVETSDWVTISDTLDAYAGAVNSDDFTVTYRGVSKRFKKGTVLLAAPQSEPGFENGVAFERISAQLMVRTDGWKHKVLDQGYAAWSGTPDPAKDPDVTARAGLGDDAAEPMLLNGKGKKLAAGGKPVFLLFPRRKGEKPFRKLGFDEFG